MAITVKHSKVSTIPDGDDSSVVRPSDWNADHQLVGTVPVDNGGTGASTLTGYVKGNGTSAMTASSTIPNTDVTGLGTMSTQNANNVAITGGSISGVTVSGYIPTSEKAQPLGVATLDAGGKVPQSQIPLMGDLNYQGTWNASTNTPTLTSSVGTKGYYYVVDVSGNTNLNGITDWVIGDWAIFNGTVWQKVDNTDAVTSVNGQVGTVVLTTTNIAEGTNEYFTTAKARASVSGGTGISYDSGTGVITNSSPSLGGDVVGPASATDNAIARYDTTTGKLLQNSVVTIGDTGAATGFTTLSASTSVTTPIVQASNSGGLSLKNASGTTQMSMGAGGGDNMSINVSTNLNGTNAQIDISPTGTGHVHIKPTGTGAVEIAPTNAGTINNMVIGGTTPLAITGTTITATSFVGSGASLTNVVNSATAGTGISVSSSTGAVTITNTAPDQTVVLTGGTGISTSGTYPNFTITNTSPSLGGTVTSVAATVPSFLSVSGSPITTSGTLALTYSGTALPVANGGTGLTSLTAGYIPFGNGTSAFGNTSSLFWDNTNLRLGVSTNTPKGVLDVSGTGASSTNNWAYISGGNVGAANPAAGFSGGIAIAVNYSNGSSETNLVWGNGVGSNQYFAIGKWTGSVYTEQMRLTSTGTLAVVSKVTAPNLQGPAFSAYKSVGAGNQTITSGVNTKVTFDTEVFDTNNNFASSTFTPNVAGYYQVSAGFQPEPSTAVTRVILAFFKNGSIYSVPQDISYTAATFVTNKISASFLIDMNGTTDYIEVYVWIFATTAVIGSGLANTWFNGSMVRSA